MTAIIKLLLLIGVGCAFIPGCSGAPAASGKVTSTKQALTSCARNSDCDTGSGEHCGLDGACHTQLDDPGCGLYYGTYPDCDPDPCRISFCVEGTYCDAGGTDECTLLSPPPPTSCIRNSDCTGTGQHCGLDGTCHTQEDDPGCGLYYGTYPDCDPDPCRISFCVEGTYCDAGGTDECTLGSP